MNITLDEQKRFALCISLYAFFAFLILTVIPTYFDQFIEEPAIDGMRRAYPLGYGICLLGAAPTVFLYIWNVTSESISKNHGVVEKALGSFIIFFAYLIIISPNFTMIDLLGTKKLPHLYIFVNGFLFACVIGLISFIHFQTNHIIKFRSNTPLKAKIEFIKYQIQSKERLFNIFTVSVGLIAITLVIHTSSQIQQIYSPDDAMLITGIIALNIGYGVFGVIIGVLYPLSNKIDDIANELKNLKNDVSLADTQP